MEEARCEAVFPDNSTPVLMIGVKCLCFRAKAAHIPPKILSPLEIQKRIGSQRKQKRGTNAP